ncbi:MAG: hypothetical protein ACYSWU_02480 [Planctomycetota bacterium]
MGFDDSKWLQEAGPFHLRPNRKATTEDTTIYLRSTFESENPNFDALRLLFTDNVRRQHSDVYLNGVLVARLCDGPSRVYAKVVLRPECCGYPLSGSSAISDQRYSGIPGTPYWFSSVVRQRQVWCLPIGIRKLIWCPPIPAEYVPPVAALPGRVLPPSYHQAQRLLRKTVRGTLEGQDLSGVPGLCLEPSSLSPSSLIRA